MRLRAKASDIRDKARLGRIKAPKSRSWRATTLGDLVKSIVTEHGFAPVVGAALAAIPHLDQSEESAIPLPGRPEAGAECRIEDGGYTCSLSAEVPKTIENQTEAP